MKAILDELNKTYGNMPEEHNMFIEFLSAHGGEFHPLMAVARTMTEGDTLTLKDSQFVLTVYEGEDNLPVKPCPYCGESPLMRDKQRDGYNLFTCLTENCHASYGWSVLEEWNRRQLLPAPPKEGDE